MDGTFNRVSAPARRRLSSQDSREQLLQVGLELFASRPYDEVWIEEVATLANVSRGLLYHYFPTKRDFFAAIVQHEGAQIFKITVTDPKAPVPDQVAAGLDAYLSYAREHAHSFRAFHRAADNGDPRVRAAYESNLGRFEQRVLDALRENAAALGIDRKPPELVRMAVRGWLAFMVRATHDWLDRPELPQPDVRDLCVRVLMTAVTA